MNSIGPWNCDGLLGRTLQLQDARRYRLILDWEMAVRGRARNYLLKQWESQSQMDGLAMKKHKQHNKE
jgi:hypothetical protein